MALSILNIPKGIRTESAQKQTAMMKSVQLQLHKRGLSSLILQVMSLTEYVFVPSRVRHVVVNLQCCQRA